MNNLKNSVILVLSIIVLAQSLLLIHLLRRKPPMRAKEQRRVTAVFPQEKPGVEVKQVIEEKPAVRPKPVKIQGKIVLVLDDWGYNLRNRDFITDNDFHVTISVLPFKVYSTHVAQLAYHNNKDVIVHMPMEPKDKEHYGLEEKTILTTMDARTIIRLLDEALAVVPYAKGISNHMGSKATEDRRLMTILFEYLKRRQFFFLDSLVTPRTACRPLAKKFAVSYFQRDVFIDNEGKPSYIRQQLYTLVNVAKRKGLAVGVGHDRPSTIAVLKEMIPQLEQEGYQFVNLSEVIGSSD